MRVAEAWKLGTKGKDDGVLVVVAVKDRKVRIEVGGGLEGGLTDAQSGRIIRSAIVPAFREGRYGEGLHAAGQQILGALGALPAGDGAGAAAPGRRRRSAASRSWAPCSAFLFGARLAGPHPAHHRLRRSCGRSSVWAGAARAALGRRRVRRRRVRRRRRRRWRLERRRRRLQRRRRLGELVGAAMALDCLLPEGGPGAHRRGGAPGRGRAAPARSSRWWWSAPSPTRRPAGSRAVVAAALATGLVELLVEDPTVAEVLLFQVLAGVVGWLAGRLAGRWSGSWPGRRHQEEAVRARAEQAFFEHGLHQTRDGTGVLVFASLREHRAVIIGDRGIHARMGDGEWQRAVDALVAGMRRGTPGQGFVAAIDLVGARLAEHFPRRDGEPRANELPDGLNRGR